ncbi:flagellar basal body rod protein FlgC [Polynucleobacter corsicus]|uniref:flagellar basal body rod protein FlgC n=1 Tax=Polynucleobacter corsicus TaxID=2081042 RepID=UPI001BFD8787|nr:flagellar basal body rod protein FlgC [Polynucleobacter corsicus]QWE19327.1 flagellar basal body rod protein FlgC [Polynucleobacter corsicus]
MSLLGAFDIGSSGLVAQAMRLNVTASNVANAESVAGPDGRTYRSRQVLFTPTKIENAKSVGVQVSGIVESAEPLRMEYKPYHPMANASGYVEMPNVNPVEEMVNMISASRSYQANVEMMNTTRQLMLKTLDLGR